MKSWGQKVNGKNRYVCLCQKVSPNFMYNEGIMTVK